MTLRASRKRKGEVSLSDPVGTDGEGNDITFMDILGTDQEELEEEVIRRVTLQRVRKLLEKLPPRERLVLELRYGLVDGRVYPQHEVAGRLGISRSYVSRVEKHGLEMLRQSAGERRGRIRESAAAGFPLRLFQGCGTMEKYAREGENGDHFLL